MWFYGLLLVHYLQEITVDNFTEDDLRGAIKSEIDTLGTGDFV